MTSWTPTSLNNMKAIVAKASDINNGKNQKWYVELTDLNSLRLLLMQADEPLLITFAPESKAPAEAEILIYDDFIEGDQFFDDEEDY